MPIPEKSAGAVSLGQKYLGLRTGIPGMSSVYHGIRDDINDPSSSSHPDATGEAASAHPPCTFLFCVPVRSGVMLLSAIGLIGGGILAAAGIIGLMKSSGAEKSSVVYSAVHLLLSVISGVGLLGAFFQALPLVRIYLAMLAVHTAFSVAGGTFAIYRVFRDSPNYVVECILGKETNAIALRTCHQGDVTLKALLFAVFVLFWLVELWSCSIVHSYARQLRKAHVISEHIPHDKQPELISKTPSEISSRIPDVESTERQPEKPLVYPTIVVDEGKAV